MPIIDQLNKLLLLTILPFVNNFLTFLSKIEQLRHSIVCQLSDSPFSHPLPPEPTHTGLQLDALPPDTASEVSKLLTYIPSKTLILDYIPTSLLNSSHVIISLLIPCLFKKVASLTRLILLSSLLSSKSLTLIRAICQTVATHIQSEQQIKNIGKTFPLISSTTHLNIPQFQPLPISAYTGAIILLKQLSAPSITSIIPPMLINPQFLSLLTSALPLTLLTILTS